MSPHPRLSLSLFSSAGRISSLTVPRGPIGSHLVSSSGRSMFFFFGPTCYFTERPRVPVMVESNSK
jgi:hypothetical protein